ncbi:MAG: YidB family protein [Burkholderiaceae bacterium]
MNILNSVLGALGGGGDGNQNPLLGILTNMLASSNEGSGLGQLVQQFQQNGLGDAIQSWIGSGQNMPVSADQIMQALGADRVGAMAQQAGIDPGQASGQLADMLPQLIDKLTPNGEMPSGDLDLSAVSSVLGSLFNR